MKNKLVVIGVAVSGLLLGSGFLRGEEDQQYEKILTIKGEKENALKGPIDVAVDKNSNICVADAGAKTVVKFDKKGNFIKKWETNDTPSAIAVDKDGNIWVGMKGKLVKFDPNGKSLSEIDGGGEKGFGQPFDIVVTDKYIYVDEPAAGAVKKYEIEKGKFVSSIPIKPCCGITGIGVHKDKNLIIARLTSFLVQVYDENDRVIQSFGKRGDFWGCCNPVDVAADEKGNFYVTLKDRGGLKKFSSEGKFLTDVEFPLKGCARYPVAVDKKGEFICVVDIPAKCVQVFGKKSTKKEKEKR